MAAHGVASADAEPDQDADDSALHDSALTDHSMQTDDQKTDDARDGPRTAGKVGFHSKTQSTLGKPSREMLDLRHCSLHVLRWTIL